ELRARGVRGLVRVAVHLGEGTPRCQTFRAPAVLGSLWGMIRGQRGVRARERLESGLDRRTTMMMTSVGLRNLRNGVEARHASSEHGIDWVGGCCWGSLWRREKGTTVPSESVGDHHGRSRR